MPLPCAGVIKSKFDSLILVYCGACLYWLLGLHSLLCDLIVALSKAALPKRPFQSGPVKVHCAVKIHGDMNKIVSARF